MSEIIKKGEFNPGCIYRIALQDFVTYREVEFYPGKSLNLIIGPNGTGKSTFVCAIILGLCGKPSAIGRDTKISTFVRNGCTTASIEIELYNKRGKKNIIIKRIINTRDISKWFIDSKSVTEKFVQEQIKSLNIQVDNLCQLLPQDKVQEFSALKPKELLESTLRAVGRYDSIEKLKNIIELKDELLNLTTNLKRNEKNLEKHKRDNERLNKKIEEMNKRKEIEREIEICEQKLLWVESQTLKAEVVQNKKEKLKAAKVLKNNQVKIEPFKNEVDCLKKCISELEGQKLNNSREIQDLKDQLKKCINSFDTKENQLKSIDTSYQEKKEIHRNKERELVQAKMKLDKLITDRRALELNKSDENNLKFELEDIHKQKQTLNAAIETLNKRRTEDTYVLENHIKLYGNRIRNMEDVQVKRLETLNRYKQDTYKALMWLRKNRDKFKHPVYEPMMLEINFEHPKFARYLESTVPAKDLIAFTFESTEDMNLFNSIVRKELKLKLVNAICSQGGNFDIQSRDLRNLSYLGFYTCLLDTVTGPAAILRYLCTQYRIDRIPIGNDHTLRNSEKVPEDIKFFFTENHRFTVRVSAYGAKYTTTIEIRNPTLLANTVDEQQITSLKNQLLKYQHDKQTLENEINDKLGDLENKLQELHHRGKEKREFFDKIKSINTQILFQTNKIKALENEPTIDIEQEKAKCKEKYINCVTKQCSLHSDIVNIMDKIQNQAIIKMKICMLQLNARRAEMLEKDSLYRNLKSELQAAITTLEDIDKHLKKLESKEQQKLNEMVKVFGNKLPTDPTFPYIKEFNDLPSDTIQLQEYKNERSARLNLMENIDMRTLKEYDERNKEIERLTNLLKTSSETTKTKKDVISKIKSELLPPLESLIDDISTNFAKMFERSGRAGEITLYKGNGDDDFSAYGVHMMVKFRADEQLSPLTRHTQSGGERAFCTAIYLLALQAHTVAPFRCVDEINQGLDAINERIMLQLLIQETTKSKSQYFLLSPTLLLNLEYNEKVTVHTVMNGEHIVNYKQWNHNEFLRRARNGFN